MKNLEASAAKREDRGLNFVKDEQRAQRSSHQAFSLLTSSSSSGVKSFLMLKRVRISSGVFPEEQGGGGSDACRVERACERTAVSAPSLPE